MSKLEKINCAECSQLVNQNSISRLISRKDRGGLIKLFVSVVAICFPELNVHILDQDQFNNNLLHLLNLMLK
jgi:hypothetical protein